MFSIMDRDLRVILVLVLMLTILVDFLSKWPRNRIL
jgi:ABC-type phosphate/phosphonate transport system permease subunit